MFVYELSGCGFESSCSHRNYLIEETNRNELASKKRKKVCRILNHIEHVLILGSIITGCVSISSFASLVGIPIGITSSGYQTMLSFCLKCRRNTESKNPKVVKDKKQKNNAIIKNCSV